ncbi:MAG: hypothetical protein Q8918_04185 [Bacteroidota bacterium]|nr:hypothetical protein [Bacteroidota bacterium]
MTACTSCTRQKKINPYVSLRPKDRIPYGTLYAFENLPALFPKASIVENKLSPKTFYYDTTDPGNGRVYLKTYIIIGRNIVPDKEELESMVRFAASGHQVFMSSLHFGGSLLKTLNLKINESRSGDDSLRLSLYEPQRHGSLNYIYPGYCLDAYFESFDTAHTLVLGRNYMGKPDFIRIAFRRGGAIFVHLAPMAFTNFFLLHKQNKSYYDFAFSYLPKETNELMWDDYFQDKQMENFSALQFILGNRSLKWAFWLVVCLFVLLYILESKRKQRVLAARETPGNPSVDFVKTIGRLYLQQKNNQNLAIKMIAAFLEHVRLTYHMQTSMLNDDFSGKLALRSGVDRDTVRKLVDSVHYARMRNALTDQELMDLHQQMQIFNKPL